MFLLKSLNIFRSNWCKKTFMSTGDRELPWGILLFMPLSYLFKVAFFSSLSLISVVRKAWIRSLNFWSSMYWFKAWFSPWWLMLSSQPKKSTWITWSTSPPALYGSKEDLSFSFNPKAVRAIEEDVFKDWTQYHGDSIHDNDIFLMRYGDWS